MRCRRTGQPHDKIGYRQIPTSSLSGARPHQQGTPMKRMKWRLLAGTSLLALAIAAPSAEAAVFTFDYTGAVVSFVVPTNGEYQIIAYGAQGGGGSKSIGGKGAEIGGDFILTAGERLEIVIGGAGS